MLSKLAKTHFIVDKYIIIDLQVTLKLLGDGSVLSNFTLRESEICPKAIII